MNWKLGNIFREFVKKLKTLQDSIREPRESLDCDGKIKYEEQQQPSENTPIPLQQLLTSATIQRGLVI